MEYSIDLALPATGVIITGGASGIGLAAAKALAAAGRPVSIWDIDGEKAKVAADEIAKRYQVTCSSVAIDLTGMDGIQPAIEATQEALPSIGGLVHAAGIVDVVSIDGITSRTWDDLIAIHLKSLAFMVKALIPDFRAHPGSAVVAITSINATLGNSMNPVYTAAKGGMLSMVRSLADRLAQDGVRINAVSPGFIDTPMTRPTLEHLPAGTIEKRVFMGRVGQPREVAKAIRFLMSEEASYITGTELIVDGGFIPSQRM